MTTRFELRFGPTNAGLSPTFDYFARADTFAALAQPTIVESPLGKGLYYFDVDFSLYPGVPRITYQSTLNGVIQFAEIAAGSVPAGGQAAVDGGAGGAMSLASIRARAQQESDTENDPHISTSEWNGYINSSLLELYGTLIRTFGSQYYSANAEITTDGTNAQYPLPDGALYGGAPAYFKGMLAELISGPSATRANPITLSRFNFHEKNRFNFPGLAFVAGPYLFPRYDLVGSTVMFAPLPTGGLTVRLWYAPRLAQLVNDTDVADDFSGWLEFVVLDAAIKALGKQERDSSLLVARRVAMLARIKEEAENRNIGDPATVTETQGDLLYPGLPNAGGLGGGWPW